MTETLASDAAQRSLVTNRPADDTPPVGAQDQPLDPVWINRDLGWLEFNRRVLAEALDERTPLLERVKFLAIFTSNLDEFFMKRMAILREDATSGGRHSSARSAIGCSPCCRVRRGTSSAASFRSSHATACICAVGKS
jgi:polyphosphate kinase